MLFQAIFFAIAVTANALCPHQCLRGPLPDKSAMSLQVSESICQNMAIEIKLSPSHNFHVHTQKIREVAKNFTNLMNQPSTVEVGDEGKRMIYQTVLYLVGMVELNHTESLEIEGRRAQRMLEAKLDSMYSQINELQVLRGQFAIRKSISVLQKIHQFVRNTFVYSRALPGNYDDSELLEHFKGFTFQSFRDDLNELQKSLLDSRRSDGTEGLLDHLTNDQNLVPTHCRCIGRELSQTLSELFQSMVVVEAVGDVIENYAYYMQYVLTKGQAPRVMNGSIAGQERMHNYMYRFKKALQKASEISNQCDDRFISGQPLCSPTWFNATHTFNDVNCQTFMRSLKESSSQAGGNVSSLENVKNNSQSPIVSVFSLRMSRSDVTKNMVVTRVRLHRNREFTCIAIQQAQLLPFGGILTSSAEELDCAIESQVLERIRIGEPTIYQNMVDYVVIDEKTSSIDLDAISGEKNYLVTGVKLAVSEPCEENGNRHLKLVLEYTKFDFGSGRLLPNEGTKLAGSLTCNKLKVSEPVHLSQTINQYSQSSANGYIDFKVDWDVDAREEIISPFLDSRTWCDMSKTPLPATGVKISAYAVQEIPAPVLTFHTQTINYADYLKTADEKECFY